VVVAHDSEFTQLSDEFDWPYDHPSDYKLTIHSVYPTKGSIFGGSSISLDISGDTADSLLFCDFYGVNRTEVKDSKCVAPPTFYIVTVDLDIVSTNKLVYVAKEGTFSF